MNSETRRFEYQTGFYKSKNLREELETFLLESSLVDNEFNSGIIVVRVIDEENVNSETGRVIVSFRGPVVNANFDYEAIVKELIKPLERPVLNIEIIAK
jgi:hypothetical protein